jgi:hypothetical protein
MPVPFIPKQIWIDESGRNDTIITAEGYAIPEYLYYAKRNWQTSADTNLTHGFRNIAIRFGDSILVKPLNDFSTNYDGPFYFHIDENKLTLQSQNILDTSSENITRIFVPLH